MWPQVLAAIDDLFGNGLVHAPYSELLRINERYLHHFFSRQIQLVNPNPMNLCGPIPDLKLHPEWPTYKQSTGLDYGQYRKIGLQYQPVTAGWAGFLDFTLGEYDKPEIAVEFKLLYGRKGEPLTFDFIKLLDNRNHTFKKVVSAALVLRPNLQELNRYQDLANAAYVDALNRLGNQYLAGDRIQRFILTVLAPEGRRHWYNGIVGGTFQIMGGIPPLPV
jgi:hypothetical protein